MALQRTILLALQPNVPLPDYPGEPEGDELRMMRAWVDFVKFKRNSPFYIHPEEASSGAEARGSAVPGPGLRGCCCVAPAMSVTRPALLTNHCTHNALVSARQIRPAW